MLCKKALKILLLILATPAMMTVEIIHPTAPSKIGNTHKLPRTKSIPAPSESERFFQQKSLWQEEARKQFDVIEQTLKNNHPGAVDTESDEFRTWLTRAQEEAPGQITKISNEKDLQQFLIWYTKGFNDGHLSISFNPELAATEPLEWPGFLMTYDPSNKTFQRTSATQKPRNSNMQDVWYVSEIDGISVKKWLDENRIPYHQGAQKGLESSYVKTAPWALTTYNLNDLSKKPTIILETYGGPLRIFKQRTIILNWKTSSYQELYKKITNLRSFPKSNIATITFGTGPEVQLKSYPVQIRPGQAYAWIKIPTFDASTPGVEASLRKVAKEMKRAQVLNHIVFDLRGNTGGDSSYAEMILKTLFGAEYFAQNETDGKQFIDWRASADNIEFLKNHPFLSPETRKAFLPILSGLKKSLADNNLFFRENSIKITDFMLREPSTRARIYILIDAQCASAALDFIDLAKRLVPQSAELKAWAETPISSDAPSVSPPVKHPGSRTLLIGQPTSADSVYMDCRILDLPQSSLTKTKMQLYHPMKVYRGRQRKNNEPHSPDHLVSNEYLNDNAALLDMMLRSYIK